MRSVTVIGCVALVFVGNAKAQDEEARHLLHALPSPFIVYRDTVQKDLKLLDDQKQKLLDKLPDYLPETKKVLEKVKNLKDGDQDKELRAHRQKSGEKFEAVLKETLTADQLKRLQQLKLQYDLPAILVQPEIGKELKIIRKDREGKIEAILNDAQKKQWKEMLGKPLDLGD